jgi:hypothetical protein
MSVRIPIEELRERQVTHLEQATGERKCIFSPEDIRPHFDRHWARFERLHGLASLYLTICADLDIPPKKECTTRVQ